MLKKWVTMATMKYWIVGVVAGVFALIVDHAGSAPWTPGQATLFYGLIAVLVMLLIRWYQLYRDKKKGGKQNAS